MSHLILQNDNESIDSNYKMCDINRPPSQFERREVFNKSFSKLFLTTEFLKMI